MGTPKRWTGAAPGASATQLGAEPSSTMKSCKQSSKTASEVVTEREGKEISSFKLLFEAAESSSEAKQGKIINK